MSVTKALHMQVRAGSEKARIWAICDALYEARGSMPSGREVVDAYVAEGGNEGTGFSQYSHWKKAMLERGASAEADAGQQPGSVDVMSLYVSSDGRLLIPAAMRAAMVLPPDGRVTAEVIDGELRVVSPMAAVRRIQKIAQKYKKPGESVVDAFLAERRAMWGEE